MLGGQIADAGAPPILHGHLVTESVPVDAENPAVFTRPINAHCSVLSSHRTDHDGQPSQQGIAGRTTPDGLIHAPQWVRAGSVGFELGCRAEPRSGVGGCARRPEAHPLPRARGRYRHGGLGIQRRPGGFWCCWPASRRPQASRCVVAGQQLGHADRAPRRLLGQPRRRLVPLRVVATAPAPAATGRSARLSRSAARPAARPTSHAPVLTSDTPTVANPHVPGGTREWSMVGT